MKEEKFVYDPEKGIAAFIPSREDSFERLLEEGSEFVMEQPSVEDVVERWTLMRTLVEKLTEEELDLMCQIFVFRKNDAEAAKALNIPKSTLSDRKKPLSEGTGKYWAWKNQEPAHSEMRIICANSESNICARCRKLAILKKVPKNAEQNPVSSPKYMRGLFHPASGEGRNDRPILPGNGRDAEIQSSCALQIS